MPAEDASPRLILGLKLRRLRQDAGLTLSALSAATGLSISYLSEIEKGKKYPKPERIVSLAQALGVSFDELVSLRVAPELSPLTSALGSSFLQEFPFDLFGFDTEDLVRVVSSDPIRAGALIQAVLEVGQSYDVDTESFLLAALRAYQQMHGNHFDDLEAAAADFRRRRDWAPGAAVPALELDRVLTGDFGYRIDYETLERDPLLRGFRSAFRRGDPPVLYVNGALMPSQRAFVLAREVGHALLGLQERALTSSWLRVESFDQVLDNFKASYFSGALLLDRETVRSDMERLFASTSWRPGLLRAAMERFETTPETYFTRLTQLIPEDFGLRDMYFVRMTDAGGGEVRQTKQLNMSSLPLPVGLGLGEHRCRRWPAFRLLASERDAGAAALLAQRSHFIDAGLDFFVISTVRPLTLDPRRRSSVTVGWRLDAAAREVIRFWNDEGIADYEVNFTCERCPLDESRCGDRVAPATVCERLAATERRERAVTRLVAEIRN